MNSDVDAVAERLRFACMHAITAEAEIAPELFADAIDLRHQPASPVDGVLDKDVLLPILIAERSALRRAVSDLVMEVIKCEVNGNRIDFAYMTRGVKPDGTPVSFRSRVLYTVQHGKITGLAAIRAATGEDSATMLELIQEGGFDAPGALAKLKANRRA